MLWSSAMKSTCKEDQEDYEQEAKVTLDILLLHIFVIILLSLSSSAHPPSLVLIISLLLIIVHTVSATPLL